MSRFRRLRLCAISATFLASPLAHSQSPLPPQGRAPIVPQRPAVDAVRPAIYTPKQNPPQSPTQSPTPGLLPPDILKPPQIPAAPKREIKLTKFDPMAAEVRRDGRTWELWSGKTKLRAFGEDRSAAYEARRLIADLRLTERGAVGTPNPVMEYWLSNGEPPPLPSFSRNIMPFEPKSLRVVDDHGVYFVSDGKRRIYNFGPYEDDARQAVDVLRRYQFNELGFIGQGGPTMSYLLKNDSATHRNFTNLGPKDDTETAPQLAPRHPLDLPGLGRVGERRPFDPMRIEIRRGQDGWHLVTAVHDFGAVGPTEYQARTAMQVAQRYPLNEYVRVGKSDFGFYLSNGAAPRGTPLGVRRNLFLPKSLTAKQVSGTWVVSDGRQNVGTFAKEDDAKLAMKVIQHYGFNCLCELGGELRYFAQDH